MPYSLEFNLDMRREMKRVRFGPGLAPHGMHAKMPLEFLEGSHEKRKKGARVG